MSRWIRPLLALLASSLSAPGMAAIVQFSFSGTLQTATSQSLPPPFLSGHFYVGEAFTGSISYDTAAIADTSLGFAMYLVNSFSFVFPDQGAGSSFAPSCVGCVLYQTSPTTVYFGAGRADYGGNASLTIDLGAPFGGPPAASLLAGRSGTFSFAIFGPGGGTGSGVAQLGAVPEPATWALMIVGLGFVGATLRRPHRLLWGRGATR